MFGAVTFNDVLSGIVVETRAKSYTGSLFYSDKVYFEAPILYAGVETTSTQPLLNQLAQIPFLGSLAGIARIALSIFHIFAHLFTALLTCNQGHLYHIAKGGCEMLRGFIEAIPLLGHNFAQWYCQHGEWWMIKIYNPNNPDNLDYASNQWQSLRETRPTGYVIA